MLGPITEPCGTPQKNQKNYTDNWILFSCYVWSKINSKQNSCKLGGIFGDPFDAVHIFF